MIFSENLYVILKIYIFPPIFVIFLTFCQNFYLLLLFSSNLGCMTIKLLQNWKKQGSGTGVHSFEKGVGAGVHSFKM